MSSLKISQLLLALVPSYGFFIRFGLKKAFVVILVLVGIYSISIVLRLNTHIIGFSISSFIILLFYIQGLFLGAVSKTPKKTQIVYSLSVALTLSCTLYTTWLNRAQILGINLYYVPSESMTPSIFPGDIVLVDTWYYKSNQPKTGQIAVFHVPGTSLIYIKRLTETSDFYFSAAGDNVAGSLPSRYMSNIELKYLKGKATGVLLNIKRYKLERFLISL
jgi:signal peptidase I